MKSWPLQSLAEDRRSLFYNSKRGKITERRGGILNTTHVKIQLLFNYYSTFWAILWLLAASTSITTINFCFLLRKPHRLFMEGNVIYCSNVRGGYYWSAPHISLLSRPDTGWNGFLSRKYNISERHLRRRLVRFQLYRRHNYYCYYKTVNYISVKGIY